jgi:hypothetical protein
MKITTFLFIVLFAGIVSAGQWTNDAVPDMLDARYDYAACNVEYAKEWLDMRENCADSHNVSVFDSSKYVENLDEDLEEMHKAADGGKRGEFGIASAELGVHSIQLIGAVVKDAFQNKSLPFFSCIRDGEKPLKEERDVCREDALSKEKGAAVNYVGNELDYGREQVEEMEELGADTSGMEEVIGHSEELLDDIEPAYESGNPKKVRKVFMRHNRLVFLFRMEKMESTIKYAEPIIEDSDNSNKEEILEKMDALQEDIRGITSDCEYSGAVDDVPGYGAQNFECWGDGVRAMNDFNSIRVLILQGVFS